MNKNTVILNEEECYAIADTINMLSGGNMMDVFSEDKNDVSDPNVSAFMKLFKCAGFSLPKRLFLK